MKFLFHCPTAPIGLRRVMEVRHAAGIAVIRSRVGAIEPPVVSRITIVRDAASRMTMEEDAVKLSAEGWAHDPRHGETCRYRNVGVQQGHKAEGGNALQRMLPRTQWPAHLLDPRVRLL